MSALRTRRWRPAARELDPDQRTIALIRVLLGFESVLYSVLTPVLPHYAHAFGASKPAIGVLAAAYPAGMIPGALLGGWIATRAGVRRTTVTGLLLFTVAIVAFGFGSDLAALDGLRFVQGIACGCIWGGGLAWVIAISPKERRGEALGSVFASAIFGTLIGPLLGTVAVATGTAVVFACVGGVSLALTFWTLQHPEPPRAALGAGAPLGVLARDPRIVLGCWLILLEACTIGATGTLLPLRLSRLGASAVSIGMTFVLASLLALLVNPAVGRLVDRRGVLLPLSAGLGTTAALLVLLPVPKSPLPLAALTVLTLGGPLTAYGLPAISIMTDAIERIGAALAFGSMLFNLAWATGETIGAPAAATVARSTSDAVPLAALAALMLVTLGAVRFGSAISSTPARRWSRPAADRQASRRESR
ncbi:MAG TPA: MFS transporter [Solirubrobacteraceae bacterium]|nr:MFS transporter [Solirubrobacteraceae bacterium]